mmetsp:Transcript_30140/g.71785  ORF Transcript_30140/g.71785 Transcript_30140/m.71785 type:complete len:189 (+) Transcript_30140:74-640(+)
MPYYSLWIEPRGALQSRLQTEINSLSEEFNGPCFVPHVTLCAFTASNDEEAKEETAKLTAELQRYYIPFKDVGYGEAFHQCVFILCADDAQVLSAAEKARKFLGLEPKPYIPHLSLLYSDIDFSQRSRAVSEARRRLYGEGSGYGSLLVEAGFWAEEIGLWRTDPEDRSLAGWTRIGRYALGGAAGQS